MDQIYFDSQMRKSTYKVGRDQRGLKQPMSEGRGGPSVADTGRARRFELEIALRYRASGEGIWHRGVTRNISYSGVLFHGEDWAEPCTSLEMCLALPKDVVGSWAAEVLCRGTVTRSERSGGDKGGPLIASRISHFRFVRP